VESGFFAPSLESDRGSAAPFFVAVCEKMGVPKSKTAVAITNARTRRILPPYRSASSRE
jgi:hypothetical protein